MADESLGDRPTITAPSLTDLLLMRQSGIDSQITMEDILEYFKSQLTYGSLFRNPIINGNMELAQRGTSFAAITHNSYNLDRWVYYKLTTGAIHTITQDTDVPNALSQHSLKIDCTTADASVAAGDYVSINYGGIEGYDFAPYVGRTATLSFWVKATKTGIYCVSFRNSTGDRTYIAEYTVNVTNTWEFKTITLNFDYSGGTWDYTNGIGLRISWVLMCGSTYQGTPETWNLSDTRATPSQVNACDNVANDFRLSQVQLNEGSVALPFQPRHITEEENLCYRYYHRNYPQVANCALAGGYIHQATLSLFYHKFPIGMRATPTLTYSALGDFVVACNGTTVAVTAITTTTDFGVQQARIAVNNASTVANSGALLQSANLNAWIAFSAEL